LQTTQAAPASVLQLSIFTTVKSIPRPERYADFPVTVRLVAPGKEQTVRAPIDIVAAIDRSRSVNDDHRLEEEKAAVALLIRMLFPTDRLAIVPFDDGVAHDEEELVFMSAEGKQKTRSTLNSLKIGNGTRLSKPLERAEKVYIHPKKKSCTKFCESSC
jgi:Mg-chelatase subunit ChlD